MQFKCYMYGLIPKKGGADDIKDFRPINLASKLYKLLAKIWASKLEKVMSEYQNAFVRGDISLMRVSLWDH